MGNSYIFTKSIIKLAFSLKGVITILINKGLFLIGGPVSF